MIKWVDEHKCDLVNIPDESTYHGHSGRSESVIDLVFASRNVQKYVKDWQIDGNATTGSDHEVILFSIQTEIVNLVENPLNASYNLHKADWESFHKYLCQIQDLRAEQIRTITDLEQKAIFLTETIQEAVNKFIPKQRICSKSKP